MKYFNISLVSVPIRQIFMEKTVFVSFWKKRSEAFDSRETLKNSCLKEQKVAGLWLPAAAHNGRESQPPCGRCAQFLWLHSESLERKQSVSLRRAALLLSVWNRIKHLLLWKEPSSRLRNKTRNPVSCPEFQRKQESEGCQHSDGCLFVFLSVFPLQLWLDKPSGPVTVRSSVSWMAALWSAQMSACQQQTDQTDQTAPRFCRNSSSRRKFHRYDWNQQEDDTTRNRNSAKMMETLEYQTNSLASDYLVLLIRRFVSLNTRKEKLQREEESLQSIIHEISGPPSKSRASKTQLNETWRAAFRLHTPPC